ncbi:DUF7002 family protein [Pseudooceanicola sp. MF1-13]|uniref:DUF7002 family protein n=1 Tax=Pseudooceanicola sp. MF1-13 TaxID=3379095 RepID=UPI0038928DF7
MTNEELEEVLSDCPTLYHMAQRGSWPAIRERGLLSTTALLDLYGVEGTEREKIEFRHRPSSVAVSAPGLPDAVIRDQIPMSDKALKKVLPARLKPSDWYSILNSRVFFWLTQDRLHRLLQAGAYRDNEHDVLEIDTRSLLDAHRDRICLCPYNSGSTVMNPVARDESTFSRIKNYPYSEWRRKRKRGERIVELTVDYSVPDLSDHVRRVLVKRNTDVVEVLFEK